VKPPSRSFCQPWTNIPMSQGANLRAVMRGEDQPVQPLEQRPVP
jgi:hypothetical protein